MQELLGQRKNIFSILGIALLLLAIPLTIWLAGKQQETRSRATFDVAFSFNPPTITKAVDENFDVQINLQAGTFDISALDITLTFPPQYLELVSFTPTTTYNTEFLKQINNTGGTLRYSAGNTSTAPITGDILLGTAIFKTKSAGSSTIGITNSLVTASGATSALNADATQVGTYTIGTPDPTATTTPSTTTTYDVSSGFTTTQGPIWYYYSGSQALQYGHSSVISWAPDEQHWFVDDTRYGRITNNFIVGGGSAVPIRVIWKAPGPGSAEATITQTKQSWSCSASDGAGNGYIFDLGYSTAVNTWPVTVLEQITVPGDDCTTKTITKTQTMVGGDALSHFVDTNGDVFHDEANYTFVVRFTPATPTTAIPTVTATPPTATDIPPTVTLTPTATIVPPTATTAPTATGVPGITITATSIPPTNTPTPTTLSLIATVTPDPNSAKLVMNKLNLSGISSGKAPKKLQQSLTLDVLDNQGNASGAPRNGTLTYNSGTHTAFLNIGALNPGNYIFKIKLDKYLRKQFPGFVEITSSNQQVSLPEITLIAGDVNNDNQLNIADYHGLLSCFLEKANGASCVNKDNADLNEDGVTDEFDINILIRNLAIRQGE